MAYSMTTLAWGGIDNAAGYTAAGQMHVPAAQPALGRRLHHQGAPVGRTSSTARSATAGSDHSFWGPAEVNPSPRARRTRSPRPARARTWSASRPPRSPPRRSCSSRATPPTAATLLSQAKSLYDVRRHYRGTYDKCITGRVRLLHLVVSGYWDELVWGALWLYKATGDRPTSPRQVRTWPISARRQDGTPEVQRRRSAGTTPRTASYILLAELTGDQQYVDRRRAQPRLAHHRLQRQHVPTYTPGGEAQVDTWGTGALRRRTRRSPRWSSATGSRRRVPTPPGRRPTTTSRYSRSTTSSATTRTTRATRSASPTAARTRKWPQNIHNRTAHGSWDQSMTDPPNTRHLDVRPAGRRPDHRATRFTDDRQHYQQTEGALDYNALFSGALAELTGEYGGTPRANFPATETPGRAGGVHAAAAVNQAGTNFVEIKSQVVQQVRLAGPAPRQRHVALLLHARRRRDGQPGHARPRRTTECRHRIGPTQFAGSTYYVDGRLHRPGHRAGRPVRVAPGEPVPHHVPGRARLHKGLLVPGPAGAANATPVNITNIALYDGTTKVWGNEPGQSSPSPDPVGIALRVAVPVGVVPSPSPFAVGVAFRVTVTVPVTDPVPGRYRRLYRRVQRGEPVAGRLPGPGDRDQHRYHDHHRLAGHLDIPQWTDDNPVLERHRGTEWLGR